MVSVKIPTNIKGHLDSDKIDLSNYSAEVNLETDIYTSIDIEDYYSGKVRIENVKAEFEPFKIGSYKPEKSLQLEYLQGGWQKALGTCDIILKMEQDLKLFHIPIRVGIQEVEKGITKCELIDEILEYVLFIKPRDVYLKFMERHRQIKFIFDSNVQKKLENEEIKIMYQSLNKSRIEIQDKMISKYQSYKNH